MRENKFRAWVTEKKHDCYPSGPPKPYMTREFDFTDFDGTCYIPALCYIDEMDIMQYTDLKDKNGKEYCQDDVFVEGRTGLGYKVLKYNGAFWGEPLHQKLIAEDYCTVLLCHINVMSEIIGNIHENPELKE